MIKQRGSKLRVPGVVLALMLLTLIVLASKAAAAPGIAGDWEGTIDAGGTTLHVVLHVVQDKDGKLSVAIDSPDQGASGIAITAITYKEPDLHFEVESISGSYDGKMNKENSQITGDWKQGGGTIALAFKRKTK